MKRLLTIREFGSNYGVGRTSIYELLAAGKLTAVKNGVRTLITGESAEAWAASLPRFTPIAPAPRGAERT